MKQIFEELGIPEAYLQRTAREDRFIALVHKLWLKSLIKHLKLSDFIKKSGQEIWPSEEENHPSWIKIFISVMKKKNCEVLPLPKTRTLMEEAPFLFPQFMQYIFQTNYVSLWKNFHKKYSTRKFTGDTRVNLVDYNNVLRESISRIYGCSIINLYDPELTIDGSKHYERHLNIFPTACAVETTNAIFLLHVPYLKHNLSDCVTFSPAILEKSHTKALFIIYQLLNVLKSLHECSVTLGEVHLNDFFMTEDLWIYVFPQIASNFHFVDSSKFASRDQKSIQDCQKYGHIFDNDLKCDLCGAQNYDEVEVTDESLEQLCFLWISRKISNFTYILALNKFAGRVWGDPNCHYVFPWVTDFTSRCGKNWRDLKKSKYRLNKGDYQLDLTHDNCQVQVPHHVSDVLSSITYYVYMARRTSVSVLCKNVRTVWVPEEYPSSIQRIQEWTPDECIPEFYSDPSVFRSIHHDLEDLAVPPWAAGPEDFIEKHREALESACVSDKIHHWIDLTFGYKLSGGASVKAKNVCLNLVDDHEYLTKSGLVQLFSSPHPPRAIDSPYWAKSPPKLFVAKSGKQRTRGRSNLSFTHETNKCEERNFTNNIQNITGLSKVSPSSRPSVHEEKITKSSRSNSNQRNDNLISPKFKFDESSSDNSSNSNIEIVYLPKEYRPDSALDALEKKHTFFSKTFPSAMTTKTENRVQEYPICNDVQNSFSEENEIKINMVPSSKQFHNFSKSRNMIHKASAEMLQEPIVRNYAEIITSRRIRELKILGCIIVEIFMAKQMRVLGTNYSNFTLDKRIKNCLDVIRCSVLPPCISYIVNLLLQPDASNSNNTYPAITDIGLPIPSAHLLLEPLLHSSIPFSKHFIQLYKIFYNLKQFKNVSIELNILYHFDCNGQMCSEYEPLEKTKILMSKNIAECEVKSLVKNLEILFNEININTDIEVISILLLHIKDLMEDAPTSVLAVWYLFEPLSSLLGPRKSSQYLLDSLLKLYENDSNDVELPYIGKVAKLYHHSFLLCLMVRLGLKCFLENFVVSLVEAVGGYRDCEHVEFVLHNHSEKNVKKASHLKTIDTEQMDISGSDDSTSSDKQEFSSETELKRSSEEEIFEFEEEKNNEDQIKFLMEHLQLNTASDLTCNTFSVDEGLEAYLTDDKNSFEESNLQIEDNVNSHAYLKSPTIPISSSCHNNVMNISCEIGSKSGEGNGNSRPLNSNVTFESQKVIHRSKHKISEMSSESLIWLAHRLGPLLTAKYLSRNLLKMLALCYMGKDNLAVHMPDDLTDFSDISVASSYVVGDPAALKVLNCLTNISGLYGEQFILFQYIPHMTEVILLCKKRITPNLEGGLISCLALLKKIIPHLSDMMLMDQLQDVLLKNIILPVVKILDSTKHIFPSGGCARNILARKYLDALYVLSIRIGTDMTKKYLMTPALQRFFSIFDIVHCEKTWESVDEVILSKVQNISLGSEELLSRLIPSGFQESYIPAKKPAKSKELNSANCGPSHEEEINVVRALKELKEVFTPELAYTAYLPLFKLLGSSSLEISLNNHDRIRCLCQEYEESIKLSNTSSIPTFKLSDFTKNESVKSSNSIGSNVSLIGNRIDVHPEIIDNMNLDLLSLVSNRMENNIRHLRGNWLAYWENEIGRSDINNLLNFKQIKLQTFVGHSQSVKCLYTLDNENSFLSGSRDKTIKLWSLRSQGDGLSTSNCQWTYNSHKKPILSITFIESVRLVASCDSVVHIWDPFMGVNLGILDSSKFAPVNVLKSMPAPSTLVFASTTDGTLKILDTRMLQYVQELKTSVNPLGLIRCLAVASSGLWLAAGQSSGNITILDTRTGLILANWRAHESEVLQLVVHNDDTVISTSLDQITSVWNISDGKIKFNLKGTTEPVHCLSIHNNELISGTTANRIGIHASIDPDASFSNNKLHTDTFKGLLTSMDYLPLNKLILLGADTGNINLLC